VFICAVWIIDYFDPGEGPREPHVGMAVILLSIGGIYLGVFTPLVGMNVFVIKGIAPDVPMSTIFRGVMPFLAAMFVCLVLIVFSTDCLVCAKHHVR
jgi:TRAP-type C4-dicarboxylate transport system permease large subunit